jgi:dihydrofolate reductase
VVTTIGELPNGPARGGHREFDRPAALLRTDRERQVIKLRIHGFSTSLDGYGAGPSQDLGNPLGIGGGNLHEWLFPTRAFQELFGDSNGTTGVDNDFAARGTDNIGAWILGRNMFGPIRGDWPDHNWKGWWGDNPPYHTPVFVLTHHAREPIEMAGGTTFHFVTGGIHEALEQARQAAGNQDVRLGGGVATIRQYLKAKLVDHLHLVVSPIVLGSGENLLTDLNLLELGYKRTQHASTPSALHMVLQKDSNQ